MLRNIDHAKVIHYGGESLLMRTTTDSINKTACLKILKDEFPSRDALQRLDNEYKICVNPKSRFIRKALQRSKTDGNESMLLEYIEGTDLGNLLATENLQLTDQLHLAIDIATALADLHKQNIFHLQLQPGNILVENGTRKIYFIDFGWAKEDKSFGEDLRSGPERDIESLRFIAPEQTGRINQPIDHRADLYSFGIILYLLFTGQLPFESDERLEIMYANIARQPVDPIRISTGLPPAISDAIIKLMAKDAGDRYQSALGIKYDLEKCLQKLHDKAPADIHFPLGLADFSGRLHFSKQLIGREKEISFLRQLLSECIAGQKRVLLISGNSGSGKSALVEQLKEFVTDKKVIFVKGKFDQINPETPYATVVQTFSDLIKYVLASDTTSQLRWKKKFKEALGNSGSILTQFMPGIENLIGKQPEVPALKGIEAQNRFNYEFSRFFESLSDKDAPLVIFTDDLQWADTSSLNLFKLISESKNVHYMMLVGSFRSNEVTDDHPLKKDIIELRQENVKVDEVQLEDLSREQVHELICAALMTKDPQMNSLAEIVYSKTKGNAFYVRQFLKSISDEGFLWFDFDALKWKFNENLILQMNVSGNVAELMTSFVLKFPAETLRILKTAAAVGNSFSKRTLSIVNKISEREVENRMRVALDDGLVIPVENGYKFAHDRIQQVIYSLLSTEEKANMHLQNARQLTASYTGEEMQDKLYEITNQWNLGAENIAAEPEKNYVAKLNLKAGQKALVSTAFPQALSYFEKGLHLLNENAWQVQYDFKRQLTIEAAEAAYLSGQYDKVDSLINDQLSHSRSIVDSAKGNEILIKKLIAENKPLEAVKLGLSILRKLHISLPIAPGKLQVIREMLHIRFLLRNKSDESYDRLPEMKNDEKIAAMNILSDISSAAFFAAPNLVPLLAFKMIQLTIGYGLTRKSPFSFAAYGYILSVFSNEIDQGIRFGEIASQLARKMNAQELVGSILVTRNIFLDHRRKAITETVPDLENAFQSALESGDNEYASYAAHNIVYQLFIMGYPLAELSKRAETLAVKIEKFHQELTLKRLQLFRQSIANLIEHTEAPDILDGTVFSELSSDITDVNKSNEIYFHNLYLQKLHLALIFNLNEKAEEYATQVEKYQESVRGTTLYPLLYFYRSVAAIDSINSSNAKIKRTAIHRDIQCLKRFAKYSTRDYTAKILLLEAGYKYSEGNAESAKILFDKALKAAIESNIDSDLALIWEHAGRFCINTRQDSIAGFYLQNAYRTYKRWGASEKLQQMENYYVQLRNGHEWEHGLSGDNYPAENVDLETVLKASAALSGEIVLPRLLKKMMKLILENGGAQSGFLIMEKNEEKIIEAEIKENENEVKTLQSIPVSGSNLLSESVLNYVFLTREMVILDDATKSELFGSDPFIKANECKSILCIPLLNMGKIQAVIYLSNDLITGAFTEKGVALLKLLATQMAVSIENALFYKELENKVKERTLELQVEKKKSDDLLLNILPEEVATELKQTGHTRPRSYDIATVMFTDFQNFTLKSEKLSPVQLVGIIDECFTAFDAIISKYKMEKIKTIGDAYLCVSGLPDPKSHNPLNVVAAAVEIIQTIQRLKSNSSSEKYFDIRIGIHTGPLVAGVVGNKKFAFDIWGDTVNTASRMEENSEPNKINVSRTTYELVKDVYPCTYRGKKAAKNKGMIEMYFVDTPSYVNEKLLPAREALT